MDWGIAAGFTLQWWSWSPPDQSALHYRALLERFAVSPWVRTPSRPQYSYYFAMSANAWLARGLSFAGRHARLSTPSSKIPSRNCPAYRVDWRVYNQQRSVSKSRYTSLYFWCFLCPAANRAPVDVVPNHRQFLLLCDVIRCGKVLRVCCVDLNDALFARPICGRVPARQGRKWFLWKCNCLYRTFIRRPQGQSRLRFTSLECWDTLCALVGATSDSPPFFSVTQK